MSQSTPQPKVWAVSAGQPYRLGCGEEVVRRIRRAVREGCRVHCREVSDCTQFNLAKLHGADSPGKVRTQELCRSGKCSPSFSSVFKGRAFFRR